jgi:outer membrane protein OmpA-like peptidoglycan-associated protein
MGRIFYTFMNRNEEEVAFEGRTTKLYYCLKEGGRSKSFLEIWKNYANALAKLGGTTEYTDGITGGDCYRLVIVEKKALVQEIQSGEMLEALNTKGFIALYINFDTGKASIKPESQPTIDQIVKLLKDNPQLKVSIEGHTDNTGTPAGNMTLSKQRAEAAVAALVKQGVEAGRLGSAGWGQDKPVADNRTDEGKAKNRRVEIVKK